MAYVPDWERLADALKRVMAEAGIAEDEAKQDICGAVADRKINIRFKVEKDVGLGSGGAFNDYVAGTVRYGHFTKSISARADEVEIPTDLKPNDLDWAKSRPQKPWRRKVDSILDEADWFLEWIELCRADVTKVLCSGYGASVRPTTSVGQQTAATKTLAAHLKANPQMARADAAEWCTAAGYRLAKRAFERVWPEARERAGLPRVAPSGRKPKSSR